MLVAYIWGYDWTHSQNTNGLTAYIIVILIKKINAINTINFKMSLQLFLNSDAYWEAHPVFNGLVSSNVVKQGE